MNDAAGQVATRDAATSTARHVIIVGFGLSGRAAINSIIERDISYCVIEANPETCTRTIKGGLHIINGDARHPAILRQAGIDHASDILITLPSDKATLEVIEQARLLAPAARIVARCTFVSGGMEAHRRGADETIIAEQVVAAEFGRVASAIPASSA